MNDPPAWRLPTRIAFRFLCIYWLLYSMPNAGRISMFGPLPGSQLYRKLWSTIVPHVAVQLFGLSGPVVAYRPTGSGDTTLDYVQVFCFVLVAAVATMIWSLLDRKRAEYSTLHGWLRLLVRYTLAATLLSYGFDKVFPTQFSYPGIGRMVERLGDFSPMGLLWTFMGASPAYTIFSGICEATGGILLMFRRTTTLGAMISAATLLNVVMLNFCYDVPVKLYSSHLLLMAIFLLAPQIRSLAGYLFLNRPAIHSKNTGVIFRARWARIASIVLKTVVIAFFVGDNVINGYMAYKTYVLNPPRPPLYGLYQVTSFQKDGVEINDLSRWKEVTVQNPTGIQVKTDDDSVRFSSRYLEPSTVVLNTDSYVYSKPDPDHLVLTGGDRTIRLLRIDPSSFLLVNRGFHWIQEAPFNR